MYEVNESMITYQTASENNVFSLIDTVRNGVAYSFFTMLAEKSPFDLPEWCRFLHISDRTMQRYKKEKKPFDPVSSEKILEITMLYKYGVEVFGSKDNLSIWLSGANVALGGSKPVDLLDSSFGIQLIRDELGRIEHGIPA
ncbi:MAG: DUF2384 domain-containing protein [Bacteroidetes bacterium]|nr:DUF2384 domain-containing protein [Bacteroidota bacterium]